MPRVMTRGLPARYAARYAARKRFAEMVDEAFS